MVVTARLAGSVVGLWELVDKAKVGHGQAESEVSGRFMCRQSAVVNGPSGERRLEKLAVDVAALADRDGMIAVTEQAPVRHCMR